MTAGTNKKRNVGADLSLGVSSCLLGRRVRFDGGHKHDPLITAGLGEIFAFVPVCPEVETGMGISRETIDLYGLVEAPLLLGNETAVDRTADMLRYAARRVKQPDLERVCGFILKSKSPTCGLKKVRIYGPSGRAARRAQGLFATALLKRYPALPVIEDRELHDEVIRDNFIVRVFGYHRLHSSLKQRPTLSRIRRFHRRERLLLDAHSVKLSRAMDKLLSSRCDFAPTVYRELYRGLFMRALAVRSTPTKNARVMRSVLSRIEPALTSQEMRELSRLITRYRNGRVGLHEPLFRLRRHVEMLEIPELADQSFLRIDKREMRLRFGR